MPLVEKETSRDIMKIWKNLPMNREEVSRMILDTIKKKRVNHKEDIWEPLSVLTNSMAYGTRRFNAAFTRALQ